MKVLLIISLLSGWMNRIDSSVIDNISEALKNGESTILNDYYASSVDVTIINYQGFLDKSSTNRKISRFFSDHKIHKYEIVHKGKSKGLDSVYTIGTLHTDQGKFRIYIFITTRDGKNLIEEIKIEE